MSYSEQELDQYYNERYFEERQDLIYGRHKDLFYTGMTIYSIGENLYSLSQKMRQDADIILGSEKVAELSNLTSDQLVKHAKNNYEEALVMLLYKTGQVFQSKLIGTGIGGLLKVYKKAKRYITALEKVAKNFDPDHVSDETRAMIEAFQAKFENINQLNLMLFDSYSNATGDKGIPFKKMLIKFPVNLFGNSGVIAQRFKQQLDNHEKGIRGRDILDTRKVYAIHKLDQKKVSLNSEIFKLTEVLDSINELNPNDRKFSAMVMFNNVSPVYLPEKNKQDIYKAVKAFQAEYGKVDWVKVKPKAKGSHKEREADDRNILQRAQHRVKKRLRERKKDLGEAFKGKEANLKDEKFNTLKSLVVESLEARVKELEQAKNVTERRLSRAQRNPFLIFYNFLVRVFSRTPVGPTAPEGLKEMQEVKVKPVSSSRFEKGGKKHRVGKTKGLGEKRKYDHPIHVGRLHKKEAEEETKTYDQSNK